MPRMPLERGHCRNSDRRRSLIPTFVKSQQPIAYTMDMSLDTPHLGTHLRTVASVCAELQVPHTLIKRCLDDVGATPALTINVTDYYRAEDVERAAAYLRGLAAEGQRIAARAKPVIQARRKR